MKIFHRVIEILMDTEKFYHKDFFMENFHEDMFKHMENSMETLRSHYRYFHGVMKNLIEI
jgi:hypothetical protein